MVDQCSAAYQFKEINLIMPLAGFNLSASYCSLICWPCSAEAPLLMLQIVVKFKKSLCTEVPHKFSVLKVSKERRKGLVHDVSYPFGEILADCGMYLG